MRRTPILIAGVLLLAPTLLAAQAAPADPAAAARARVEAAMQAAVEGGIPVALLEQKVAEGKAKGVPMDRIAAAVEARLAGLTRASEVLAEAGLTGATNAELSVAADAVQAGVSGTALATISTSAPQDRRVVAIAVLADLVAMGQAPERALTEVQAALQRGPAALANLRAEAAAGLQATGGVSAGPVGAQVGAGAAGGARVEVPAPRLP